MVFHIVEHKEEHDRTAPTAIDKALDVCEMLSRAPRGISLAELARALGLPSPTLHRTLGVLKRRGYVRQDDETQRYALTLKMLDLSFQFLGRSELRLHAYPVLREWVLRTGIRSFLAVPPKEEVTYVWATGSDEVAMRTVFGRAMPAHCAVYFSPAQASRRLSCLRLAEPRPDGAGPRVERLEPPNAPDSAHRLCCTCAPVHDYSGREVARVGLFMHAPDDGVLGGEYEGSCRELARQISVRLGHLPTVTMGVTA
jgi:DNA-binding IclR family transcriptional regulator